ncbi:hypothetical protein ACS0TY_003508 [Phlomoides rotata]
MMEFIIMDCPSPYNYILGRTFVSEYKAVVSTYHYCLKFPTIEGVDTVRGDQLWTRECTHIVECLPAQRVLSLEPIIGSTKDLIEVDNLMNQTNVNGAPIPMLVDDSEPRIGFESAASDKELSRVVDMEGLTSNVGQTLAAQ